METKHTPGKWGVDNEAGKLVIRAEKAGNVTRVFVADCGLDFLSQANAALIAAAPETAAERDRLRQVNAELVAALEDASFLLAQIGKFPGDLHQFMDSIIRSVQDARAALTEAKGE